MSTNQGRVYELPSRDVDFSESIEDRLTKNAAENILPSRYLKRNEKGEHTEDIQGMFDRVASDIASAEKEFGASDSEVDLWHKRFYNMMARQEFMPNSPTLMNAGNTLQQLSACFVVSPEDDMEHILDTAKRASLIFQSGGGIGYAFSKLRPKGDQVQSTGGIASGPVSFMNIFDEVCNQVKQGGKRRGAQMGILKVDHPDILHFCIAKRKEGNLSNFNISVAITDDFIEALKRGGKYKLENPRTGDQYIASKQTEEFYSAEYEDAPESDIKENFWRDYAPSIDGIEQWRGDLSGVEEGSPMYLPSEFIWQVIIDGAWRNGEPGIFLIDRANKDHSFDVNKYPEFEIHSTNPCGEQPLAESEACNLGHINLSLMVNDDAPDWREYDDSIESFANEAIDNDKLKRVADWGTRFLDNVITRSEYPLDEITEMVKSTRKIGLGIMGYAQLLIQLGIEYGSEESTFIAEYVMERINRWSTLYSHRLTDERGTFDEWEKSKYAEPMKYSDWFEDHTGLSAGGFPGGFPIRNHNTTTIAPTGTTSMIADTSGGCEPIYRVAFYKDVAQEIGKLVEFDRIFLETLEQNDIDVATVKRRTKNLMQDNAFDGVGDLISDEEITNIFKTADEVTSSEHVNVQSAFQKHVDSSISKTVNLPHEATHGDVSDAYLEAINKGCKSIALYRDGARERQVKTTREDNKLDEECPNCEGVILVHKEGCKACPSCSFEKCEI